MDVGTLMVFDGGVGTREMNAYEDSASRCIAVDIMRETIEDSRITADTIPF